MMTRFLLFLALTATAHADPGVAPVIDRDRITVSGLSAGGHMAHQLHVAYADLFSGAGIVAGGPYGCAAGSMATAFTRCIASDGGGLPVDEFAAQIRTAAAERKVADPSGLAADRAWLFHGDRDEVVAVGVSDALAALYAEFLPPENIRYISDVAAGHNFPALGRGHACAASEPPFIGDCDYDAAGQLLLFLYGDLQQPTDATVSDPLEPVTLPGAAAAGLQETAYLYVPADCRGGEMCALHLVLHGCAQSTAEVGEAFIRQSGYLRWAAANRIVLAFPQVAASAANPLACWDWWGYTGPDYLWRNGAQMRELANWVRSLAVATEDVPIQ